MKTKQSPTPGFAASVLALIGGVLLISAPALLAAEDDLEIVVRGPVHEAFAEAVTLDPEPGLIINREPPEAIEELPPEQQPVGDNVTWIPGYWAWDEERDDFLWVSGIWRNIPPGRQWLPGYWIALGGGQYQWTPGYWEDVDVAEVAYIATAPPESLETGPNTPAPAADSSWVPGNWMWTDNRYGWRPGHWVDYRPDWTWVPARYLWTRHGYVYVNGYWDYDVYRRGTLFAPVYYPNRYYRTPGYSYTPSVVIALDLILDHLFVSPRHHHYYFGDYYEPRYRDSGYYISFSWHSHQGGYDPIYAHQRWRHRGDRDWFDRRERDYIRLRDHREDRPPRTWSEVRSRADRRADDSPVFARTLDSLAKQEGKDKRYREIDKESRDTFVAQAREVRKFQSARRTLEASPAQARDEGNSKEAVRVREKLGTSPVKGRRVEELAKDKAPPRRPDAGERSRARDAAAQRPERGRTEDASPGQDSRRNRPQENRDPQPQRERSERAPDKEMEKPKDDARKGENAQPERGNQRRPAREDNSDRARQDRDEARQRAQREEAARRQQQQNKAASEQRAREEASRKARNEEAARRQKQTENARQQRSREAERQKQPERREIERPKRPERAEQKQPQRERTERSKEPSRGKASDDKKRERKR